MKDGSIEDELGVWSRVNREWPIQKELKDPIQFEEMSNYSIWSVERGNILNSVVVEKEINSVVN